MELHFLIGIGVLLLGGQVTQIIRSNRAHAKTFTEIENHTLTEVKRPVLVTHIPIASPSDINGDD